MVRREENLGDDHCWDLEQLSKVSCIVERYSKLLICFHANHEKNLTYSHLVIRNSFLNIIIFLQCGFINFMKFNVING